MSLQYVRDRYGVPARRGGRVRFFYSPTDFKEGHIKSVRYGRLRVKFDDGERVSLHPDYQVQYLNDQGLVVCDRTEIVPSRPPDGEFRDFRHWVNCAKRYIGGTHASTFDAKGRRCRLGRDFMRADEEGAFPVRFWFPESAL